MTNIEFRRAEAAARQVIVADRTPEQKLPVRKLLPVTADTPYKIGEILKLENLDSLLDLLGNPLHTDLQRACLYAEVKSRRALEGV